MLNLKAKLLKKREWKVILFRLTLILSLIGVSIFISDPVAYKISTFLFENKPHGSLIAVLIGMVLIILELLVYLFLRGLLAYLFAIVGWLVISPFIEKTKIYNYILSKVNKLPKVYGWIVWISFSSLPFFVLYLSLNIEVMIKPEFNNIYKNGLIKLNGHMDKTMMYKIKAKYLARNDSRRKCRGQSRSKSFNYYPRITNTLHAVIIPLDAVKENFCDYQIDNIKICLTRNDAQQNVTHKFGCYTLFTSNEKEGYMYDGHLYQKMKDDTLNIYCGNRKGTNINAGCTQDQRKQISITQHLKAGNHAYLVNIYDK